MYNQPTLIEIAAAIHYPNCWDTATYPTLESAIWEIVADFKCSNDQHEDDDDK